MKKRIISMLLVMVLLLSVLPAARAVQMTEDGEYIFKDSRGNEVIVPPNAFATRVVDTYTGKKWTTNNDCKDPNNLLGRKWQQLRLLRSGQLWLDRPGVFRGYRRQRGHGYLCL